jgi:hypothetical protein
MKLAQTTLSRRDSQKIARRFNAGNGSPCAASPAGTAENVRQFRPSLRDLNHFAAQPGVETPGYCRSSLRDKTAVAASAGARASARFNVHLHETHEMSAPLSIRTLKRSRVRDRAPGANESQRDSGLQPKVARHELPWVNVVQNFSNPNGVAASRRPTATQPRWGCEDLLRLTQGSRFAPTLGWRTQSRWDWTRKISAERGSVTRSNVRIFQAASNDPNANHLAKLLRVTDPRSGSGAQQNKFSRRECGSGVN